MTYKMKGTSFYGKSCMCNADTNKGNSPMKFEGIVVEGSKAAKKQERQAKKAQRKAARQEKKDLKAVGGDQAKLDKKREQAATRQAKRDKYRLDYADKLAKQGKAYNVQDASGEIKAAERVPASTRAKQQREGTFKTQTGAAKRETAELIRKDRQEGQRSPINKKYKK